MRDVEVAEVGHPNRRQCAALRQNHAETSTPGRECDEPLLGAGGMYAEQHRGLEAFSTIAGEWDDLFRRSEDAMPYLARPWAATFVGQGKLQGAPLLITVRAGQKLAALLALSVRRSGTVEIAEPVGTAEPSYLGVLLDPRYRPAIQCMADFIAKETSIAVLCLQNVSSTDRAPNELLAELGKKRFISRSARRDLCPYIKLGCSFEEYLKHSKSREGRKKLRYRERKLLNSADVVVHRYVGEEITAEILSRVGAIQEASWMKKRGASVLGRPCYRKLLLEMAKAGLGTVWLMTIDGRDAAFRYAFVAHGRLCSKWSAFDLKYEPLQHVGRVLTMRTIRDACEDGVLSFDFMHGDSQWKCYWATDFHDVNRVATGRGFAGRLVVLWLAFLWWMAKQKWIRTKYRAFRSKLRKARNYFSSPGKPQD